jgi:hypothetical protein
MTSVSNDPADAPMCGYCGHFFVDDPTVGEAHAFLYGVPGPTLDAAALVLALDEVILDMGNDRPDMAAAALASALTQQGWPEPEDIQAAVLHHWQDQEDDRAEREAEADVGCADVRGAAPS